jgi:hypothetical protein
VRELNPHSPPNAEARSFHNGTHLVTGVQFQIALYPSLQAFFYILLVCAAPLFAQDKSLKAHSIPNVFIQFAHQQQTTVGGAAILENRPSKKC